MAQNENGNGRDDRKDDDAALQARLESLSHKLDARKDELSRPDADKGDSGSASSLGAATNLGFQALIEFVTAVVVGPIIGWEIDAWLNTKPIFFIIFLFIGMAAGLLNVYRMAMRPPGRRNSRS